MKRVDADQLVIDDLRVCALCGADTREACEFERERRDEGTLKRRSSKCLYFYDPATAEWPEGF